MNAKSLWGRGEVVFSAPTAVKVEFAANGADFSATLTDGGLQFQSGEGPTSLTQVLSLRVPVHVATGRQLIGYLQNVTFGIQRSPDVRVLIVADLAGTTKVVEFDYDNSTAPTQDDPLRQVRLFSPQGVETAGGGQLGLAGPVADYAATLSITMQRRTTQGQGMIRIDTLDVFAVLTPPPVGKD